MFANQRSKKLDFLGLNNVIYFSTYNYTTETILSKLLSLDHLNFKTIINYNYCFMSFMVISTYQFVLIFLKTLKETIPKIKNQSLSFIFISVISGTVICLCSTPIAASATEPSSNFNTFFSSITKSISGYGVTLAT